MKLNKFDTYIVLDAITFTVSSLKSLRDKPDSRTCSYYEQLAAQILKKDYILSQSDKVNICKALEIFVQNSDEAGMFHSEVLDRFKDMIS